MKLIEVNTPETVRCFLTMPIGIYKNDTNWIRPWDSDIEAVFDPQKNKFFRHGEACRWILKDDRGCTVGRVAAFINQRSANAKQNKQPTGGMGFFECIDDQEAANILLDQCKSWLSERGMEAMDGPINFGERDGWWGLLVDGFYPPTYRMNYNPEYYQTLLENYGFKLYFEQYVFQRNILDKVPQEMADKYNRLMEEGGYSFKHIKKKQLGKFAKDFRQIYNEAWGRHPGFKEMSEAQANAIMKIFKPIIVEWLMWFGYYEDRPIAFFIMIPDLNVIIKDFKGKSGWWQKLRLIMKLKFGKMNKCYGVLFGVVPDFQRKGLDGAIIEAASHVIHPKGTYNHMEMNWIGDFNPKMVTVAQNVGGVKYKTYWTMRYLFDQSQPYERYPIIG